MNARVLELRLSGRPGFWEITQLQLRVSAGLAPASPLASPSGGEGTQSINYSVVGLGLYLKTKIQ